MSPRGTLGCSPIPEGTTHLSVSPGTCPRPHRTPVSPGARTVPAGRVPLPPHTVVTLCPHRPICRSHGSTHRDCALGPSSDVSKYSCAESRTVRSQPNFASPGARVPDLSVTAQGLSRPCPPPAKRPPGPAGPAARGPHPAQVCPSERSLLTAEVGVPGKATKQGLGFNAANTLKLDVNVKVTLSSLTHLENWKVLPGVPCPPAADPATPPLALAFAGPPGTRVLVCRVAPAPPAGAQRYFKS